jgi:hypothetical protein
MAGLTDTWELNLLNHFIGNIPTTVPATIYVGLSTTTINTAGGNITEPSGGSYVRLATANNAATWPSGNPKVNGVTLQFVQATAGWGQILDFFLSNHLSSVVAANIIGYGTLTTPVTVNSGNTPSFGVGALRIRLLNP